MPLTILAHITAAPEKADLVRSELEKLLEPTRAEAGCLRYDLHVDNANPNLFVMFENWTDKNALDAHLIQPHIAAFGAATKGAIAGFSLNELTKLG
jgi:quinol monooxygenase YgiN